MSSGSNGQVGQTGGVGVTGGVGNTGSSWKLVQLVTRSQ